MSRFLKHAAWVLVGLGLASPALGTTLQQLRASAEESLMVTGHMVVGPDGQLRSYQIDDANKLPAVILDLIAKSAAGWRFKPVTKDGHPVAAKAHLSLRIVAQPEPGGRYRLSIGGAQFGRDDANSAGLVTGDRSTIPHYPSAALFENASAYVYLALQVDRNGKVVNAVAMQVNLTAIGPDAVMNQMRKLFAISAEQASKHWTFKVPSSALPPTHGYWTVVVPIHYCIHDETCTSDTSGPSWHAYIPGPLQSIPWQHTSLAASNIDAMPNHGLYDPRDALTLVTKPAAH